MVSREVPHFAEALVLGVSSFRGPGWRALRNAGGEADRLAEEFQLLGCKNVLRPPETELTGSGIREHLKAFVHRVTAAVKSCHEEEQLLVTCAILSHGLGRDGLALPEIAGLDSAGPEDRKSHAVLDEVLLKELNRVDLAAGRCKRLKEQFRLINPRGCHNDVSRLDTNRGPGREQFLKMLSKSRVDFMLFLGCDPGRIADDDCSCTSALLPQLKGDVVNILEACENAADQVDKRSGGKVRPWTECRGKFRSIALRRNSTRPEEGVNRLCHLPTLLGHAEERTLLKMNPPQDHSDTHRQSVIFRTFYIPYIWVLCLAAHLATYIFWFHGSCPVQCNSRCTVPPAWISFCWAAFTRTKQEPIPDACSNSYSGSVSLHWASIESVHLRYVYPCFHIVQAIGEVTQESDHLGACVSLALALFWILLCQACDVVLPVLEQWRESSCEADVKRCSAVWRWLFCASVCNSIYSFRLLLGGSDADFRMVEVQFHLIMFFFALGVVFTFVHNCNLAKILQSPAMCLWQFILLLTIVWIICHGAVKEGMATAKTAFNFGLLLEHVLLMLSSALAMIVVHRQGTDRKAAGLAEATPCSTPQRFPRAREVQGSAAFESLPAQISSPSTEVVYTERVPARPSLPATPEGREQSASPPRSPPGSGVQTSRSDLADSACTQGAGVLLDFLTSLLYTMKRPSKADRPRAWEDPNSEGRSEVQHQLIYDLFVSTPLISTMFLLVDKESGSVPLLTALLQHAVNRADTDFALAVVTRCLPHVSLLCTRVLGSPRLRPREPLGALRVEATQILAALAVLSPDRLLPLVKPAVWKALSEWFFLYRCNHIFQAACSKLWVQIIRFGSPELQHLIFVKGHLLRGLCHAVLGEGSCGDRWHDLLQNVEPDGRSGRIEKSQVPQQRPRHPGGLGSMVPVVRALSELEDSFKESKAPIRQPLAEKQVHEVPMDRKVKACAKPLLVQLLSATSLWPQVLKALPPAPPLGDVVAPFQQVPRKPATTVGFDI
eukprot:s272_g2.t4